MYKIIYPTNNTTLYELYPDRNTSMDQILELWPIKQGQISENNEYLNTTYNSRILLKFNISELNSLINNKQFEAYLNIHATEISNSPSEYSLYTYPLSGSYKTGTGFFNSNPEFTTGVSWNYRSSKQIGQRWQTSSYDVNITGSLSGGGNWYTNIVSSQSFENDIPDVYMNVTNIVSAWLSGSIVNDGFILKYNDSDETNLDSLGHLQFFSRYTHTIYVPRLDVYWNDVTLSGTGSFSETTSNDTIIYISNLKDVYRTTETAILRIMARERYPNQTYSTSSNYLIEKRLPINSYYQIEDVVTNEKIVAFNDLGTQISCDNQGNFIKIDCQSLMPERYYKIIIKSIFNDGSIIYFDNKYEFRITR